jgi:hypothetical protein
MSTLSPRVVVVSRRSELDELLARHGTRGAAAYFLRQRGRDLDEVTARHEALRAALTQVGAAVPADWRRGHVDRADLPRFLFAPEDVVVAVGQDGLVANVAKYVDGQPVIGVDPEPGRNAGVLVRHSPAELAGLLGRPDRSQQRTMVVARLDDGQELYGLNEVPADHFGRSPGAAVVLGPDRRHRHRRHRLVRVDRARTRQRPAAAGARRGGTVLVRTRALAVAHHRRAAGRRVSESGRGDRADQRVGTARGVRRRARIGRAGAVLGPAGAGRRGGAPVAPGVNGAAEPGDHGGDRGIG